MIRIVRLLLLLAGVLSLSLGIALLSRHHPWWWVGLVALISLSGWFLLERFATLTIRYRERVGYNESRRLAEEWRRAWRQMIAFPLLLSAAFLLANAQRVASGKPFFDVRSISAFVQTVGFPVLMPLALLLCFVALRDVDLSKRAR